jgi:hypothetical protein
VHWRELAGDSPAEPIGDATNEVRFHGDFVIKFPGLACGLGDDPPEMQLLVEYLAYRVYARFGVRVPEHRLVHDGRRVGLATRKVEGPSLGSYLRSKGWDLEQVQRLRDVRDLHDGFFVDVLLANWDVIGLTGDNVIVGPHGLVRIDPGGSLTFRAQGERKGEAFGDFPGELTTMRDPAVGTAGRVFARMPAPCEARAAEVLRAVSRPALRAAVEAACDEVRAAIRELGERDRAELTAATEREFGAIVPRLMSRFDAIVRHLAQVHGEG